MKLLLDYRLYLVTDRNLMTTPILTDAVQEALEGGVTLLQLREKQLAAADFLTEANTIKKLAHDYQVPLIINDNLEVAQASNADGLHIGQNDLPVHQARAALGPDKILGVSIQTVAEAQEAEKEGATYLGVGAMFNTNTKNDTIHVSHETLQAICQAVQIPIVVIGGIKRENISQFQQDPIQGFAVVSAILQQPDIQKASRELRQEIDRTLQ
ncbi:thiamine phosphate synthase [Lactobacillus sp. DCY120]|uniref:Thiamine-phosphate synthase n=1 Tax=Bombilactobacillus apium TaxID=2675299 RepID=A0A850QYT4_9LACO|nr:thiamine phosphate synthase [Bombilactobacillus apium]NVY97004.1 thiamine phosphate synthase [Bombilactobacillus apium]